MRAVKAHLCTILLIAACGGKSPDPATPPAPEPTTPAPAPADPAPVAPAEPAPAPAPEPAPPPKPHEDTFIKLSKDEKTKIMKEKVTPAMAKAFKTHDAKKFAKFDCKSCHGKSAGKDFKMPNPDLPKLDFELLMSGKADPKVMAMAKFMGEVVTPETAKILGLAQFDPQKPELGGFGCLACHEQKK
jgi:hypothetical protein